MEVWLKCFERHIANLLFYQEYPVLNPEKFQSSFEFQIG